MKQGSSTAALAILGLVSSTAATAADEQATGIVSIAPATILITLALAIVLTMVGRPLLSSVSQRLNYNLQRRRVLRELRSTSTSALHDFILPGSSGGLVPIDHAIKVAGGAVCLQVKYYKGSVFTNDGGTQWSSVDGGQRHRFMNPILQNDSRLRAIRNAVPELPVLGLVVFAGEVDFPDGRPEGVVSIDELKSALDELDFDSDTTDAVEDWEATWLRLQAAALTDDDSRKDLDAQVSFG